MVTPYIFSLFSDRETLTIVMIVGSKIVSISKVFGRQKHEEITCMISKMKIMNRIPNTIKSEIIRKWRLNIIDN